MDNKANMNADMHNRNIENKLEELLKEIPVQQFKEVLNTYYSFRAQQLINDKNYLELSKLEWLIDLHWLLENLG